MTVETVETAVTVETAHYMKLLVLQSYAIGLHMFSLLVKLQ